MTSSPSFHTEHSGSRSWIPRVSKCSCRLFQTLAARRIDVRYLFPGGIGIARNVGAFVKRAKAPLDDLIPGWRDLKRARVAAGQKLTAEETASYDQPFVMAFRQRMGQLGFQYSEQVEPYFTNEKNVKIYHLLFFRNTPRAWPYGAA